MPYQLSTQYLPFIMSKLRFLEDPHMNTFGHIHINGMDMFGH